ncbi:unknown [Mycoplasma sp. CAG:776]|nr:unknown [Mycoplasma sp. CAG:776]
MKKTEKYIYLVIILILLVVISCGITYILATNKNNEETKEENNESNNKQEGENNNQNNEEEITLSEEELKEYLKYIPKDIINEEQNMYINPKQNDNLSNQLLLGATLNYADNYTDLRKETESGDEFLFPKDEIRKLMKKLYDKEIVSIKELEFGCVIYSEDNNNYKQSGGCGTDVEHISSIKEYKATKNELVIYEYAAYYNEFDNKIGNYYTSEEMDLDGWCGNTSYEEKKEILENYLKVHSDEFTLYKHTFKKNDTGYYWYSTEIASEE